MKHNDISMMFKGTMLNKKLKKSIIAKNVFVVQCPLLFVLVNFDYLHTELDLNQYVRLYLLLANS